MYSYNTTPAEHREQYHSFLLVLKGLFLLTCTCKYNSMLSASTDTIHYFNVETIFLEASLLYIHV